MNTNKTANNGRIWTGAAAMAGGVAMTVTGVIQAVRPIDDDPRVLGEEHLLLALFAAFLLLTIPALLALARYGGPAARAGALAVSAGHVALTFGATSSNLNGEDFWWFPYVAAPANLAMLVGAITLAVSLWRAGRVPRLVAAALPVLWLCEIVLSQLGGGLVAGPYWIVVGRLLVAGFAGTASRTASTAR